MITTAAERNKYTRIWEFEEYRSVSPGEELIEVFKKHVPFKKGETIVDLGCGTGRAAAALSRLGLEITGLDIAANCLDVPYRSMPFIQACLWEPDWAEYTWQWFYCTDVMEHIPPEHVDTVLDNIYTATIKGGFFQIAMFKESYGKLIGDNLHLTIQSGAFWHKKLADLWRKVTTISNDGGRVVFVVED